MALIPVKQALENIMKAKHGEEVRTSIHDAIFIMDQNANEAVDVAITSKDSAKSYADSAEVSKNTAKTEADRAKDEADRAASIVHVDVATTTTPGIVKPDGETIEVEADGTISVADSIADLPSYLENQKEKGFLESPNLVKGTDDWSGEDWINNTSYRISSQKLDGCTVLEKSSAWNGIGKYINLKANKKYIFSVYVKSDDTVTLSLQGSYNNYSTVAIENRIEIGKDWQRISLEYTPAIDQNNFAFTVFARSNVNYYVAKYMVEESETLSEYLPFNSSNTELTEIVDNAVNNGFISRNKFDKNNLTKNTKYNASGTLVSDGAWATQIIPIDGSITITSSGSISAAASHVWQDSNKTLISVASLRNTAKPLTLTPPSNAKYIGVSVATIFNEEEIFQVEDGSKATPYTEYAKSNAELTEEISNSRKFKDIYSSITVESDITLSTKPNSHLVVNDILMDGCITFKISANNPNRNGKILTIQKYKSRAQIVIIEKYDNDTFVGLGVVETLASDTYIYSYATLTANTAYRVTFLTTLI